MYICLNSIENVKKFVAEAMALGMSDVDLRSERYVVCSTSIMGIFSLDLTKPIKIVEDNLTKEQRNALIEKFGKIITLS